MTIFVIKSILSLIVLSYMVRRALRNHGWARWSWIGISIAPAWSLIVYASVVAGIISASEYLPSLQPVALLIIIAPALAAKLSKETL